MRKKVANTILGAFFILVGIGYAGNQLNIWNFDLFFDGFWTLTLIIPAVISIIKNGFRTGNMILFIVGIIFLAGIQDSSLVYLLQDLFWPIILVAIGVSIIFSKKRPNNPQFTVDNRNFSSMNYQQDISAVFSGKDVRVNEKLYDTSVKTVFGGVTLDLRNAIIDSDVNIYVQCIFGGVDIFVPPNVEVKISDSSVFGGVSNKTMPVVGNDAKKIYLAVESVFGGVEIK